MLYAIIAAIILIGDQWLKYWVTVNITLSTGDVALIPGVVKLVNIHNSGAAFGFLSNTEYARWLFLGVAALFIIVIVVVLAKHLFKSRFANWCAVLALAGAVGNCIDRALYGYVVDMFKVEFMDFAVFNIADIFLVVACIAFVIYLIVDIFKGGKDEDDEDEDDDDDEDDEDDDEKPRRAGRRSRTVTDDKYDVFGIETLSFEFPDTATPLVSDDKADEGDFWESFKFELRNGDTATPLVSDDKADEGDFWESFKFELRNGDTDEPPKPQPAAEPKPAAPKQQPAAEPKPAAPKAKAKSSEYDLESILAEFKDL